MFAPAFGPALAAGGPARVLTNLIAELREEYDFEVFTNDRDHGSREPFTALDIASSALDGAKITYVNVKSCRGWLLMFRETRGRRFDLIILNSYWNVAFSLAPACAVALKILRGPLLVMPRGELESGALELKHRKKSACDPFYKFLYRRGAALFGATSPTEAQNILEKFPGAQVLVTRNDHPDRMTFHGGSLSRDSVLRLLFLGRIHPTKGLRELLLALRHCSGEIHLRIAGPVGDESYWRLCLDLVSRLPANVVVDVLGLVGRDDVQGLLHYSDLLAMLTAGENFGHVIAEAMQAGCPVLLTDKTPWTDVVLNGGGELVLDRSDTFALSRALDSWAALDGEARMISRRRAREAYERHDVSAAPNIVELAFTQLNSSSCLLDEARGGGVKN